MHDAAAIQAPNRKLSLLSLTRLRANVPNYAEVSIVAASALLLILAFPDFDLWWLAWIGLIPFIFVVALTPKTFRAFLLGWLWGIIFFYGTCWWLTYSMVHYGHLPSWLAYVLLLPPVLFVATFPALTCALVKWTITRYGPSAVFAAPFIWIAVDWARYGITGLAWNAVGYSQAFHPPLIRAARVGGVYAVGFLVLMTNVAVVFALLRRTILEVTAALIILALVSLVLAVSHLQSVSEPEFNDGPRNVVVAVQPNVPMEVADDPATMNQLLNRHLELTVEGLRNGSLRADSKRLVIWPESPMNFSYSRDPHLQEIVGTFARTNHTSVMLNSLEPAPNGGSHNSAIMVNEEGRIVAQYDKIRLMPFGEYVPLPRWLPGASSVRSLVGEFTPGSSYTLMPLGAFRVGVFICVEAAHPAIASTFTKSGADVLINISNDGYLGPTPVMRQHLANAIFRAVENDRSVVRVTNTGITALISSRGAVQDSIGGFEPAVRSWTIGNKHEETTFYTRNGDVFAAACTVISLAVLGLSILKTGGLLRRKV